MTHELESAIDDLQTALYDACQAVCRAYTAADHRTDHAEQHALRDIHDRLIPVWREVQWLHSQATATLAGRD